jgi:hypothetical protein
LASRRSRPRSVRTTARSSELKRTAANQPLVLEMPKVTAGIAGLVAQVVEIAFGYDPKRADGPEHAALGCVDLVDAVALSDRLPLASTREVEIPGEHVARVTVFAAVAFAAPTTTTEIAIPPGAIAVVASRIVPVPHDPLHPPRVEYGGADRE